MHDTLSEQFTDALDQVIDKFPHQPQWQAMKRTFIQEYTEYNRIHASSDNFRAASKETQMNNQDRILYIIKPYCDRSSGQLIDYLISMRRDFAETLRVITEIKDNLRSYRRLNRKLRRTSMRLDMVSRHFAGRISSEIDSQDNRLKSAGRNLNKYILALALKTFQDYVRNFKSDIDMLKKKIHR
jgi:hypothetical protein